MKRWLRGVLVFVVVLVAAATTFYLAPLEVSDAAVRFHLWRAGVHSRYVAVDGYRIHYLEVSAKGQPAATPLLLIHGLGSRAEDWGPMIPLLAARGFHVYALDLLGYGRSSKPDVDYSIALEEKTVTDFMQAVGLQHADVGGWSMGGWVALKLTVDHPARVDRLVVYDAAGIYFPATFGTALFTPQDAAGLERLQAMLFPHPPALPGFVQRAAIRKLQRNAWVVDRSVRAIEDGRDLLDFQLQRIDQPTLVVWGADDKLIPLQVGERMQHDIPGASLLVVSGCGHMAPADCFGPVGSGTVAFLRAEPPIRGGEATVPGS